MKKTKRVLGIFLAAALMAGTGQPAVALAAGAAPEESLPAPSKVMAYLKPDVTVMLYDQVKLFKDAKGQVIYPIIYKGSTYLPVRAVSNLMQENIEWDPYSKGVFIGRTLSNPNNSSINSTWEASGEEETAGFIASLPEASLIMVHLKPDITILYNFEVQKFLDQDGKRVYPIIYNGSTYLPVRAISALMKEPVEWDPATKTVTIGDPKKAELEKLLVESDNAIEMKKLFEEEVLLYDQATAKISELSKAKSEEELTILAASISDDYLKAQQMTADVKAMKTKDYTDEEYTAYLTLSEFVGLTEYYILVMENISYMALEGSDYSVLAETFFNFAMESSAKLDAARAAIDEIPKIEVEAPEEGK